MKRPQLVCLPCLLVGLAFSGCVPFAYKQVYTPGVFGNVSDAETGDPIADAHVFFANCDDEGVQSIKDGSFFLKTVKLASFGVSFGLGLPSHDRTPAKGELVVRRDGYEDFKTEVTSEDNRQANPIDIGTIKLPKKK